MMSVLMHVCNVSKYNPNYEKAVDLVKLLVENKCDVNYKNNKRMTAYLFAASHGNIDIIKYLRRYCDTDAADNQGWNVSTKTFTINIFFPVGILGCIYCRHYFMR